MLVSALDDIAWTLNLRGTDVHCNPVFVAYLLIDTKRATLFINPGKLTPEAAEYLAAEGVAVADYGGVRRALEAYGEERVRNHSASMGAEDFAFFLEKRPGCFPRVGIADETHTANHHHPNFDYNDHALGPTADFFVRLVEKRLAALQ